MTRRPLHNFVVAATLVLLGARGYSQEPQAPDWLVIPGERVGPITAETSAASLEAAFGVENVRRTEINVGEGLKVPGSVVFPDDAARRIEVVWADASRNTPTEVRINGESSLWETAEGISLGSSLRDIERLNGFPFRLTGFAFDYAGTIVDCGHGRLKMLGCSAADDIEQAPRSRLLTLRLAASDAATATREYRQVLGDRTFSSGHPAMQVLNPRVYQMIVLLRSRPND